MNSTPASTGADQKAPSPQASSQPHTHQLLPSASNQTTITASAALLPVKKSSTQSTAHPVTDHRWFKKQVAAGMYPQSGALNPPQNPNSSGNVSSLNVQLQLPNQQVAQGVVYPLGTSSRGFTPKSNAQPGAAGYGDRSAAYSLQQLGRPDGLSKQQMQMLKSGYLNPSQPVVGGGSTALQGFPVTSYPKVSFSMASASDRNGNREARSKDEATTVVLNRKVRISEGSSLYSLCRSWLKNGCHDRDQSQATHAIRYGYLPRPLSTPAETTTQKSSEINDIDEDEKGDEKSAKLLSPEELLQRHVKRARRVRSRLREERMHRIAKYRIRLANLLPTPAETIIDEMPTDN